MATSAHTRFQWPSTGQNAEKHAAGWADESTKVQRVVSFGEASVSRQETTEVHDTTGIGAAEPVGLIRAQAGHALGGRYRLEEILVRREETQTWRAFDTVLARPVMVHLLPSGKPVDALLATARRAAVTPDSRFLRVLDATPPAQPDRPRVPAEVPDHSGIGAYIICEYANGMLLTDLLSAGPLSVLESAWLVREVADALAGMHVQRLHHQRLSPDTIVITDSGTVKIVGFLLEAEMTPNPPTTQNPESVDVTDLGRLLYASLVSRWPGGPEHGMPAAPTDSEGRLLTPLQVNPSVSPALDQVCDRILSSTPRDLTTPLRSATDISAALSRVLGTADASQDLERRVHNPVRTVSDETQVHVMPISAYAGVDSADKLTPAPSPEEDEAEPTRVIFEDPAQAPAALRSTPAPRTPAPRTPVEVPARQPRKSRWIAILAVLVVLAVVGGILAMVLRPSPSTDPGQSSASGSGSGSSEQLPVAGVLEFDPEGGGDEHPKQVPLAWDGDPSTSWRTLNYKQAEIGNKSGLGLVFDLGEVRELNRAELDLDGTGTNLEIRVPTSENVTSAPLNSAGQWRSVGSATQATTGTSIELDQPVSTRYVLVFLTELPPEGGEFTGGIAEAQFWG